MAMNNPMMQMEPAIDVAGPVQPNDIVMRASEIGQTIPGVGALAYKQARKGANQGVRGIHRIPETTDQGMDFMKIAKQNLNNQAVNMANTVEAMAPPGHMLAYITPDEAGILKLLGGSGEMTAAGIPAFPPEGQMGPGSGSPGAGSDADGGASVGLGGGWKSGLSSSDYGGSDYGGSGLGTDEGHEASYRASVKDAQAPAKDPAGFAKAMKDMAEEGEQAVADMEKEKVDKMNLLEKFLYKVFKKETLKPNVKTLKYDPAFLTRYTPKTWAAINKNMGFDDEGNFIGLGDVTVNPNTGLLGLQDTLSGPYGEMTLGLSPFGTGFTPMSEDTRPDHGQGRGENRPVVRQTVEDIVEDADGETDEYLDEDEYYLPADYWSENWRVNEGDLVPGRRRFGLRKSGEKIEEGENLPLEEALAFAMQGGYSLLEPFSEFQSRRKKYYGDPDFGQGDDIDYSTTTGGNIGGTP